MRTPVTAAFNIEVVRRDDAVRLRLEGELDVASAPALDDALRRAEASGASVIVIDLTGVSFIDSTGLRALLEAHARDSARPQDARLRITPGSDQAQRLFELAGVLDKLPFVTSVDD